MSRKDEFLTIPIGLDCRAPGQREPRVEPKDTDTGGMRFGATASYEDLWGKGPRDG